MRSRVVLVAALAACGPAAQGGLANAPSGNREPTQDERGEDVVANGRRSCPPAGKRGDDPLRGRTPRCPEVTPSASPASAPR